MEMSVLSYYLRLFHADWLSPVQFSRLIQKFGRLHRVVSAEDDEISQLGFTQTEIEQLRRGATEPNNSAIENDLTWASTGGHTILCFEDPNYPDLLKEITVAPPLLFVRGDVESLATPQIAIVGSRKATSYGLRNAYWMAHELSRGGFTIDSGMARGIDTRAHEGALANRGATIAVIGTGVDKVYPASNIELADAIASSGALVSEFPLGTPPIPMNFPRRNRIMSGLSVGTLVVEAAVKSGSLITARLALEQNREVFAIPGLISNPVSSGCHKLITDGARLVEKPADIMEELGIDTLERNIAVRESGSNREEAGLTPPKTRKSRDNLYELIGDDGCELHFLLASSGLDYQVLIQRLLQLEMDGKIQTEGGRYYQT